MLLSTVILNWNRDYLLRRCVESYFATVGPAFELVIIDNGSTDGSRDYLQSLPSLDSLRLILLDDNRGGAAFNLAIPVTNGELIHLTENDQVFLPGWREYAEAAFDGFADLGQLALFADTPTDGEAWEAKPSHLRFAKGTIVYEAHGNVSTSSIVRAELFRNRGVRIENIEAGQYRFPNDLKLSQDIKDAGYWCGWSDRYYVRNVGHEVAEFAARGTYYAQNYASKPWLGVTGWHKRIEARNGIPRPIRLSQAVPRPHAIPERTLGLVDGRPARLWSMFDSTTAETEVLDFLYALTRLVKPAHVLETGTWLGLSACAIGRALRHNGFGHLITLEDDPAAHSAALENIESYHLADVIDVRLLSGMEFVPNCRYDMAVFDSNPETREAEFRRLSPDLSDGAFVAFHDTVLHSQVVGEGVKRLLDEGAISGLDFPTPRGLFVGRLRRPPVADEIAGPERKAVGSGA